MRMLILLLSLAPWAAAGEALAATAHTGLAAVAEPGCRPLATIESTGGLRRPWLGPDGTRLPFRDETQVLEFLRTADIVSAETTAKGITKPLKVLLEQDGIRAHAVFRHVSVSQRSYRPGAGRHNFNVRDSCFFEPAAYELGRLLGIHRIPPVVERRYLGRRGTLQIWVENAFDEQARLARKLRSPDPEDWLRQKHVRRIFDALIHNIDRNQGNVLIDPQWNVWLIDHTRAFLPESDLPGRRGLVRCDRGLWQRLLGADRAVVTETLDPYLSKRELRSLFVRWDKLIEHVQGLIAAEGEASVLF